MGRQQRRILTEQAFVDAVGAIVRRDGVDALGVNAIAVEAGADKALIYRYFDGLPGLLRAYGERGDFWPTIDEVFEGVDVAGPDRAARVRRLFANYASGLRRRPVTLALLAFEQGHRNELTVILEETRERWSDQLDAELMRRELVSSRDAGVLGRIFSAAINYLAVRSRDIRVFGGVDVQSDSGWDVMLDAMEAAFRALDGNTPPSNEDAR